MLGVKAVGVAAAATIPEGGACIDVFVKEPQLDIIATLETSVQLTRRAEHTHLPQLNSRAATAHQSETTCSATTFPSFQRPRKTGGKMK